MPLDGQESNPYDRITGMGHPRAGQINYIGCAVELYWTLLQNGFVAVVHVFDH